MTNDPADRPGNDPGDENNPFKGTPFEQLFSAFGGGMPGATPGAGGPAGMPDLSMIMSQMQAMMAPYEGSVNWTLAKDVARKTVAQEPDPSPGEKDRGDVADALRLADHWLDQATDFPSGVSSSVVWSRAQWVEETIEVWQRLGDGLDVSDEDVLLYLALREAAHQRLFAHVPWLRAHLISAVEDYGRGTTIDVSKIESSMADLDPMNPAAIQQALEGGLFEPEKTPAQQAALARLETTLALVEGWVDEVVGQATETRMPSAARLQEAVRRRRAAGGPAESTFAALVGLELRPRRLRDASALWGSLRSRQGTEARDAVWAHPDLLPTAEDLDDPLGFREHVEQPEALTDAEFDAALADLLDSESGQGGPGGTSGDQSGDQSGDEPDAGDGPER